MSPRPSREQLGLPEGRHRALIYNPKYDAAIVCIEPASSPLPVCRLYWRKPHWKKYRPLGRPREDTTFDSPITGDVQFVFFIAARVYKTEGLVAAADTRLGIADLRTSRIRIVEIARGEDGAGVPITRLLAVSAKGPTVYCAAEDTREPTRYRVFAVNTGTLSLSPRIDLPGTWF